MRNTALQAAEVLVGEARWIGDAFIELRAEMEGEPVWHFVFDRSDPHEQLMAFYHDPRPTSRVFHMTFGNGEWTLLREYSNFRQRFVATVANDRIHGRWDASEDAGATWRKDFDVIFERTSH